MPADSRVHHHPMHHPYPPPGMPGYPSASPHPMQQPHLHSSRHVSNGPPPPSQMAGGPPPPPPQLAMQGGPPPPEPVGPPPPNAVGNGHAHPGPVNPNMSSAARAGKEKQESVLAQLAGANENTWLLIGAVSQQMNDHDRALAAFQNALRHNPNSIVALNAVASIARGRDDFDKAIEYFHRILEIKQDNGEVWGSMGHCLLMKDELPKAYTAYQQALYHLTNPREPKLWYGIGILYDRYGSFEHAEEAFSSVLKMDQEFEKANEIYFRLGIIYKHQRKYRDSLDCFRRIINDPPRPLTSWDIWFQLGHVYELDQDYNAARDAYMRVLGHQPDHAKVLQQLGWLYHQPGATFANQDQAVAYLTKSLETDGSDPQSWYLLGRAYMAGQRYNKAYEAYQQAVYRDGRNPTFWCSIGVLYFQINQYRDALDAYSRAIRINPYISEVWYNLGSLYESCNNQITDAIDAYSRAAELDPSNSTIKSRLQLLQNASSSNAPLPPAPPPVDVHPSQYAVPPAGGYNGGSPGGSPPRPPPAQLGGDGPIGRDMPAPHPTNADPRGGPIGPHGSPGPFRGAAPPPLAHVDESRGTMSRMPALAPMDTERPDPNAREYRDGPGPGYGGHGAGPGRYDPTSERHGNSPSSPRRRAEAQFPPPPPPGGPQGYPGGYPPYPPPPGGSFRERDEWERRERDRRVGPPGLPGPQHDLRNPSPRLGERGPYPGPDPRDYPRQGPGGPEPYPPPHPYDRQHAGPGPYPYDRRDPGRYDDRDRERERDRDRDREVKMENLSANGGGQHRSVSVSRDQGPPGGPGDFRAPSPAMSTSSKTSVKRKIDRRDRDDASSTHGGSTPSSSKKARDDKAAGGSGGPGSAKKVSPTSAATPSVSAVGKDSGGSGERSRNEGSPGASPAARQVAPNRAVDEDYDEGAADALMFLHGDRGASAPNSATASVSDREAAAACALASPRPTDEPGLTSTSTPSAPQSSTIPSTQQPAQPSAVAGTKRTEPPSPSSPISSQNAKKSKPEAAVLENADKDAAVDEETAKAGGAEVEKVAEAQDEGKADEPVVNGNGVTEKDFAADAAPEEERSAENGPESKADDEGARADEVEAVSAKATEPEANKEVEPTSTKEASAPAEATDVEVGKDAPEKENGEASIEVEVEAEAESTASKDDAKTVGAEVEKEKGADVDMAEPEKEGAVEEGEKKADEAVEA